jgi:hypothetical protein
MSEYPKSRANKPVSEAPALFDDTDDPIFKDKEIEHIVDTQHVSYDAARRILGVDARPYEAPKSAEPEIPGEPTVGVAVDLGERAIAIDHIMKAYSQANKAQGASGSSGFVRIAETYRHPEAVVDGMFDKSNRMKSAIEKDYAVLTGRDDLLKAGMSPEEVAIIETNLKLGLLRQYGPGNAYVDKRDKLTRKVTRTARKVNGRNKKAA